jgi:hypothetical protein
LSSCLDATRMWRSTERASLEKKRISYRRLEPLEPRRKLISIA